MLALGDHYSLILEPFLVKRGAMLGGGEEQGMVAVGGVIVALGLVEFRRRRAAAAPGRFRLVEYTSVAGQPSRFQFADDF